MRRQPNKLPKSFRLDIRLTERLFRELRKVTKRKKLSTRQRLAKSSVVELLAIREREKRDNKAD
jgi:hypothetical protein